MGEREVMLWLHDPQRAIKPIGPLQQLDLLHLRRSFAGQKRNVADLKKNRRRNVPISQSIIGRS